MTVIETMLYHTNSFCLYINLKYKYFIQHFNTVKGVERITQRRFFWNQFQGDCVEEEVHLWVFILSSQWNPCFKRRSGWDLTKFYSKQDQMSKTSVWAETSHVFVLWIVVEFEKCWYRNLDGVHQRFWEERWFGRKLYLEILTNFWQELWRNYAIGLLIRKNDTWLS